MDEQHQHHQSDGGQQPQNPALALRGCTFFDCLAQGAVAPVRLACSWPACATVSLQLRIRMGKLGRIERRIPAGIPDRSIEIANDPRHIEASLAVRRNAMPTIDRRRPGVISGQRQRQVVVVAGQQGIEITRAARDILIGPADCRLRPAAPQSSASAASAPARLSCSPPPYGRRSPPAPRSPAGSRPDCVARRRSKVIREVPPSSGPHEALRK